LEILHPSPSPFHAVTAGRRLTIARNLRLGSQGAVTDAAAWVDRKFQKAAHDICKSNHGVLILHLPYTSPACSTVAIGVFHRGGSQAGGPREEMRRSAAVIALGFDRHT